MIVKHFTRKLRASVTYECADGFKTAISDTGNIQLYADAQKANQQFHAVIVNLTPAEAAAIWRRVECDPAAAHIRKLALL